MKGALPPGSTIGIIGGGQLGRMLAMAAARLNFNTVILEPQAGSPAAQLANRQITAAYDDPAALAELAGLCEVVTYEFENVPVAAAEMLAKTVPVYPPPKALEAPKPTSSSRIHTTFGDPAGARTGSGHHSFDSASVRPTCPW